MKKPNLRKRGIEEGEAILHFLKGGREVEEEVMAKI